MKQVYLFTGPRGGGKSTSIATYPMATAEDMAKMLIFDTEDSQSDNYKRMQDLGMPFDIMRAYERFKPTDDMLGAIAAGNLPWITQTQRNVLVGYYEWFIDALSKKLDQGKYKYLGIDTIEPIEAGMTAWAEANKSKSGWSGVKAYGRLEVEAVRPLYENMLEAIHRRGVEVILLTSHLKRVWEDDKPIMNKVQPGGRLAVLARLSTAMFWLSPNSGNADGAPAAIVLKARKGKMSVVNGRWSVQRIMPMRVPHFSWWDLDNYEEHPADLRNPAPGEMITPQERDMISEFLTEEQMRLMVLGAERELAAMQVQPMPTTMFNEAEAVARVRELMAAGMSNAEIVAAVPGTNIPLVLRVRRDTPVADEVA